MSYVSKLPKNYVWWVERERLGLGEYGKTERVDCITSPTSVSNGKKIRLLLTRRALDFDALMTSQSEIPPQFHEALAYKAISMGYTRGLAPNIQLAQYYEGLYRQAVKAGRKYSKTRHLGTGRVAPQDF